MSRSLFWRPVVQLPENPLPDTLRRAIARKLWKHDGTPEGKDQKLDEGFIPYLEELQNSGIDGAAALIDAIRKHGRVMVWIGYPATP